MDIAKVTKAIGQGTLVPLGNGAQAFFGIDGRHTLHLEQTSNGVRVSYRPLSRGARTSIDIADDAQLAAAVPELQSTVRSWAARLSPHDLRPGKSFRVLQPLLGFSTGDEIEVVGDLNDPQQSATLFRLRRRSDGRTETLTELADADLPILRDLDLYLA